MFTAQKILERRGLPSAEEKGAMFRVAQEKLLESGYLQIGLDHFVLSSAMSFIRRLSVTNCIAISKDTVRDVLQGKCMPLVSLLLLS